MSVCDNRRLTARDEKILSHEERARASGSGQQALALAHLHARQGDLTAAVLWALRAEHAGEPDAPELMRVLRLVASRRSASEARERAIADDPDRWGPELPRSLAWAGLQKRRAGRALESALVRRDRTLESYRHELAILGAGILGEILEAASSPRFEVLVPLLVRLLADSGFPPARGLMERCAEHPDPEVRRLAAGMLASGAADRSLVEWYADQPQREPKTKLPPGTRREARSPPTRAEIVAWLRRSLTDLDASRHDPWKLFSALPTTASAAAALAAVLPGDEGSEEDAALVESALVRLAAHLSDERAIKIEGHDWTGLISVADTTVPRVAEQALRKLFSVPLPPKILRQAIAREPALERFATGR